MSDLSHFKRNPETGLYDHINYVRFASGKINWRAMINPDHIIFKTSIGKVESAEQIAMANEIEKTYGASARSLVYGEVIKTQEVDDKHILVMLAGFQELAYLRGYTHNAQSHLIVSHDESNYPMVSAGWLITWIPNAEDPYAVSTGGVADATKENTGQFKFMTAAAGNRAFVRAVKSGLGIRILAYDEIGKGGDMFVTLPEVGSSSPASINFQPTTTLINTAKQFKLSFEDVKASAVSTWDNETNLLDANPKFKRTIESNPSAWEKFSDVPPIDCLTLIDAFKSIKGKGKK